MRLLSALIITKEDHHEKDFSLLLAAALFATCIGSLAYENQPSSPSTPSLQIISNPVPQEAADYALERFSSDFIFDNDLKVMGLTANDVPNLRLGNGFTVSDLNQPETIYFFPVLNDSQVVYMVVIMYDGSRYMYQPGKFDIIEALNAAYSINEPIEIFRTNDGFAAHATISNNVVPLKISDESIEANGIVNSSNNLISAVQTSLSVSNYATNNKTAVKISSANLLGNTAQINYYNSSVNQAESSLRFVEYKEANENIVKIVNNSTCWAPACMSVLVKIRQSAL